VKKFTENIKRINENKKVDYLCVNYYKDIKSVNDKYNDKVKNMIISLLDAYSVYKVSDELDTKGFDLYVEIDDIYDDLSGTCKIDQIIKRHGRWVFEFRAIGDMFDMMDPFEMNINNLSTEQLVEILSEILNQSDILNSYSVNTIKKINEN
tara:strand:+ start:73079 stop:73531 length:453 start_codon:yes stop_codon:yes gene_type:complete